MTATGRAIGLTVNNASLRRAQLSFALIWAGEWAVMVTLGVVAFRDGGAAAVGVATALRMLPAALLAPFAAVVADAVRRERVLACVGVIRAATLGAAAAVLALDGPLATVCALMVLATIAQTLYRPTHSALLPVLCAGPDELTAANLVRGLLDSIATLAGPLAAAVGLAISGPATVFAASAACSLWAGILVVGLRYEPPPRPAPVPIGARASLDGLRAIAADRGLLLVTGLATAQTFTRGALSVMSVIVAIRLLETGPPGAGILNGAVGAGALLGSCLALLVVRPGRLARWLGIGVALWGLPVAGIGAVPQEAAAIALLAVVGIGNAFVDVGAFTLPARLADERVMRARVRRCRGNRDPGRRGRRSPGSGRRSSSSGSGERSWRSASSAPCPSPWRGRALRRLDVRMRVRDADVQLLPMVPCSGRCHRRRSSSSPRRSNTPRSPPASPSSSRERSATGPTSSRQARPR